MWADGTLLSFDIESTGVSPEDDRIVTASVVQIDGTTGECQTWEWLADPGIEIPQSASDIHGITTEYARTHGRTAAEVVNEIAAVIDQRWTPVTPLIVYNAAFDITMLDREVRRHLGRAWYGPALPVVDPLVLDRTLDPYRKTKHVGGRTLTTVSAHYGVPIKAEEAHGATADALCSARIAWQLAHHRQYGAKLADLVALQTFQRDAHRKWAAHTNDYFTSQGKPGDISPDWPYRPVTVEAMA